MGENVSNGGWGPHRQGTGKLKVWGGWAGLGTGAGAGHTSYELGKADYNNATDEARSGSIADFRAAMPAACQSWWDGLSQLERDLIYESAKNDAPSWP